MLGKFRFESCYLGESLTHLLVRKQAAMVAASHIPPLSGLWSVPAGLVMPAGLKYLASQCGQVSDGFGCGQKHI